MDLICRMSRVLNSHGLFRTYIMGLDNPITAAYSTDCQRTSDFPKQSRGLSIVNDLLSCLAVNNNRIIIVGISCYLGMRFSYYGGTI